jgi:hypothetical protein
MFRETKQMFVKVYEGGRVVVLLKTNNNTLHVRTLCITQEKY